MTMNHVVVVALFFTLALAQAESYASHVVLGSVACLDCTHEPDLSGIRVMLKCDNVKNQTTSYTEKNGVFEAKLPSDDNSIQARHSNCMAWIAGGPRQLYVSAEDSAVPVVETMEAGQLTTSKPLGFYRTCSVKGKCGGKDMIFGSSKTFEWGLAPSSYYIPFFPIIGIP